MEDNDAHADLYPTSSHDHSHQDFNGQWSIFRVPAHLREVDDKAYRPRVVSIGPFHIKDPRLTPMEAQKLRFYNRLTREMGHQDPNVGILTAMKRLESDVRKCYSEEFDNIPSHEFVNMLVLDSCFIVELMRLNHSYSQGSMGIYPDEPIFATRWMLPNITRDLLMLENQVPMFVLEEVFGLTTFDEKAIPLKHLALSFFEPLRPQKGTYKNSKMTNRGEHHHHLLSLFHSSFVSDDYHHPSGQTRSFRWNRDGNLPGKLWVHEAKRLKQNGIRFRNNHENLLDVKFSNRELTIPTLFIDECTGPLLRNLVAYEQCDAYVTPYFTCYAIFLNSIIHTTEDLEILQHAGIIMQSVGEDEDVVKLIKSLTKELVFDLHDMDNNYIAKQIEDINSFCQSWVSKCLQKVSNMDLIGIAVSLFFPSFR